MMELGFKLRDDENAITNRNRFHAWTADYKGWTQKDKVGRAIVDLSLSDNILEQAGDVTSAEDVLDTLLYIFERYTLLEKVTDR